MMLKIENLHATVDDKPILRGLDLSIGAGEVHAIMGPNGAGKSTLAYVLGGRPGYEVTEGSVTLSLSRHPRPSFVIPAKAGTQRGKKCWVLAFAGMTKVVGISLEGSVG